MRYFKAIEIPQKPFIQWDCYANSFEEFKLLKLDNDHTIMQEDHIPANVNGVCPLKIVNGELVNRDAAETIPYEGEHINKIKNGTFKGQINVLNTKTFEYQGEQFFLHDSARLLYETIDRAKLDKIEVKTADSTYFLSVNEMPDFMDSYQTALVNHLTEQ